MRAIGPITSNVFTKMAEEKMPFPIKKTASWRGENGETFYMIELDMQNVAGAKEPTMHVTFHLPAMATIADLKEALEYAASQARRFSE